MENAATPQASRRSVLRTSALGVGAAFTGAASVAGAQAAAAAPGARPAAAGITAGGIFLLLDSIPGDSLVKGHEKAIEVVDASWGVTAETSWTKGGGASVGKPNPGGLSVTLPIGSHTPWLLNRMVSGKAVVTGQLDILRAGAGGAVPTVPALRLKMSSLFVTSLQTHMSSSGDLYEDVTFVFKDITYSYFPQKPTGAVGTETKAVWDIPAGTITGP